MTPAAIAPPHPPPRRTWAGLASAPGELECRWRRCNLNDFRVLVRIRLVTWHGAQYCVDDAGHCPTARITRTRGRHAYYHGTHRVPNADIGCSAGQPCRLQDRHRHYLCSQDMAFLPRGWYVCIAILNLGEPTFSVKSSPSTKLGLSEAIHFGVRRIFILRIALPLAPALGL